MLAPRFSTTLLILAVAALSPLPGAQAAVLLVSSGDTNSVLAYDATTASSSVLSRPAVASKSQRA